MWPKPCFVYALIHCSTLLRLPHSVLTFGFKNANLHHQSITRTCVMVSSVFRNGIRAPTTNQTILRNRLMFWPLPSALSAPRVCELMNCRMDAQPIVSMEFSLAHSTLRQHNFDYRRTNSRAGLGLLPIRTTNEHSLSSLTFGRDSTVRQQACAHSAGALCHQESRTVLQGLPGSD